MKIESIHNQKVKEWIKLKEKKYRDEMGLFLIEGDHLINEAKKKDYIKELITLEESALASSANYIVTPEIMKKITSQVTASDAAAVCRKIKEQEPFGKILILDNIQDPGNLGTMIRSSVAFSYDTIILSDDCVDVYNEKVIRSTEGMLFLVNILRKNLKEELPKLKEQHYKIYGTNVEEGKKLKEITFEENIAVIIGSEGRGMDKTLQEYIDENIYIPMNEKCESLNAAISASIIMYESGKKNE